MTSPSFGADISAAAYISALCPVSVTSKLLCTICEVIGRLGANRHWHDFTEKCRYRAAGSRTESNRILERGVLEDGKSKRR
jgi:hypothetical protein